MRGSRIRTLLIDDSSFMRRVIGDIISADEQLELIGTASNGKEGVQLASKLRPDVIVTDMMMPDSDGLYVVKQVMGNFPTPVILLSSLDKGNQRIFDALDNGAFEFIDKPVELGSKSLFDYPLNSLIKHAAAADLQLMNFRNAKVEKAIVYDANEKKKHDIILIGASTGGPGAVEGIIMSLPSNLKVPVVVAQHMPSRFLETFAQRLNGLSPLPVKLAFKGQVIIGGNIYVVPGDYNTRIERSVLDHQPIFAFTQRTYDEFNNPSINCLFESAVEVYGRNTMGIILTGMGKDGMKGLKSIHDSGGFTIAQDEQSSIVYGMPKAAVQIGAVRCVAGLKDIPHCIIQNL